jgi:hypothetical protein
MVSVEPPGGKGTMAVIGFSGYPAKAEVAMERTTATIENSFFISNSFLDLLRCSAACQLVTNAVFLDIMVVS